MTDNIQAYLYRGRLFTPSGLTAYMGLSEGLLEGSLEDYLQGRALSQGLSRDALTPEASKTFPMALTAPQVHGLLYTYQGLPWPALDAAEGLALAEQERESHAQLAYRYGPRI